MSKIKSIFVTALFVAMLGLILCGLFALESPAFAVLVGLLAAYGGVHTSISFCHWLRKVPPLLPAAAPKRREQKTAEELYGKDEFWPPDPQWLDRFAATYDEIKEEVRNEN